MASKSFVEKLAERSFHSDKIQTNWKVHMQAFGPVLTPAFTDSYQAKIHLNAALSLLSNHRIKPALNKLKTLKDCCKTDADHAVWQFCMGLCCEMQGDDEGMVRHYTEAGEYGHEFYLIDMKLAKAAHNAGAYETAVGHYHRALEHFDESQVQGVRQGGLIRASVYTNLASCLTMLFRYEEAEKMLEISREISPQQTGRAVTEAILYAAMGERDRVEFCLAELNEQMPELTEAVTKTVEDIYIGNHEHFKNQQR